MKTPILGSSYVARSVNAADNRMVNIFPEIIPEGGQDPAFLQRCPGLRFWQTVGTGPIRGLWTLKLRGDEFYVVSGTELYRMTSLTATPQLIGTVEGTGAVVMADNGTQIFIAANPKGYIYNTVTAAFGEITDPDFPGAVTVCYLDGYFVFNEPDSQKIWVTSLLDGTSIDPLEFASAEGSPDGLVSVFADHREIWAFGTDSTEVWYNSGELDFPLTRIQGAFNELGCAAPYSVAKMDNQIYWLGQDARGTGVVYRAAGYIGQRVSTHAVEWQIQQYANISDAVAYTYQQDGHQFYVLNFPSANATWVFDVATGAWHERASMTDGVIHRHRGQCMCAYQNNIIIGDYQNGSIYTFDLDYHADASEPQPWMRRWRALPTGGNNLKRTMHHSLQLNCETGVGLSGNDPLTPATEYLGTENGNILTTESGDLILVTPERVVGSTAQVMLRWSDDGGHTWSNEHWASMGREGVYGHRAIWRRLGATLKLRDRVYEVSGSDPVKIAIIGAELLLTGSNA